MSMDVRRSLRIDYRISVTVLIHLLHLFDGRVYNLHCSSPPLVMHASCHVSTAALSSLLPHIFYPGTTKSDPFWLMILLFVGS